MKIFLKIKCLISLYFIIVSCSAQEQKSEINYSLFTGTPLNKSDIRNLKSYIPYYKKTLINGKLKKIEECLFVPRDSSENITRVFYYLDKNEEKEQVNKNYKNNFQQRKDLPIQVIFCQKEFINSYEVYSETYLNNRVELNSTTSFDIKIVKDSMGRIISKISNIYNPIYRKYQKTKSKYLYNKSNKIFLRRNEDSFDIIGENQKVIKEFYMTDFNENRDLYFPFENVSFFIDSNFLPINQKDIYNCETINNEIEYYTSFGTRVKPENISNLKKYEIRKYRDGKLISKAKHNGELQTEIIYFVDSSLDHLQFMKQNKQNGKVQFIDTTSFSKNTYYYFDYNFLKVEKFLFDAHNNIIALETFGNINDTIPVLNQTKKYYYVNDKKLKIELEYNNEGKPIRYGYYHKYKMSDFSKKTLLSNQFLSKHPDIFFMNMDWYKSAK